jgi:hypothetical protein
MEKRNPTKREITLLKKTCCYRNYCDDFKPYPETLSFIPVLNDLKKMVCLNKRCLLRKGRKTNE